MFRKRPAEPVSSLGNTWWTFDDTIDYDHHVRHSAVPQPGRIRELLQLTSRWHGSLLDRHRPLWEAHVVEGLADGRIAVYSKIHHAIVDGVAAIRLMQRSLSEDPDARDCMPPWALPPRKSSGGGVAGFDPMGLLRGVGGAAGEIAGMLPARPRSSARSSATATSRCRARRRRSSTAASAAPAGSPRSRGRSSASSGSPSRRPRRSTTSCWRWCPAPCASTCSSSTRCPTSR